jgi:hypothetical protein
MNADSQQLFNNLSHILNYPLMKLGDSSLILTSLSQSGTEAWATGTIPAAHSGQSLAGLGAVILGILAVIGLAPVTLIPVGLLSLAAVMLLGPLRL